MFSTDDTIVAVATPPGSGGIGVVRLSGPSALLVARSLLDSDKPLHPRRASFRRVRDFDSATAAVLDEVVVTWFPAPRSYTTQDVVEISAHGSPVVLARIVELAVRSGARLAGPGEFTLRAFVKGRVDLVQAEAVADLIAAITPGQARVAMDQLEGTLTTRITAVGSRLFDLTARLEASIDFPEEGFHFVTRDETADELSAAAVDLERLAADGRMGRLIREGAMVVIMGRPNAGKSSLFNALLGSDRAIVTSVAGTTRDALAERVDIDGFSLTLVDTAGLREARDEIEAEGIRRARAAAAAAVLAIVVVDGSESLTDQDLALVRDDGVAEKLVVRSKTDLPQAWLPTAIESPGDVVDVSVEAGTGLDDLRRRLLEKLIGREWLGDVPVISNIRHLGLIERALVHVRRAEELARRGGVEELILFELGEARRALEELTGATSDEDLLRLIFSRFCIGK